MTSKSFNTEKFPSITPSMEKSVTKAFQEFGKNHVEPNLFNGRLKTFKDSSGCQHLWKPLVNIPKEHSEYLKLITEEDPPVGSTKWCSGCGSVSYWEDGKLWLFDSTTHFYGKPPKRKRHGKREQSAD